MTTVQDIQETDWISVREAAVILGVSHNTVRKMIAQHELSVLGVFSNRRDVVLDRAYIEREARRRAEKSA
jgi:excisionase family DNA binding protein